MTVEVPQAWRRRCGNCRFRVEAESGDRKAFYSLCHRSPPVMIVESYESELLKTWFPIVVETMWCGDFRFGGRQRKVIALIKLTALFAALAIALQVGKHIAWTDIAAAIWIP